ncbi:hypothetical protein I317_00540 [Kwoniella heveanensis CBS 569]|nr:hypothetical protein I317_00540 [Kwoniella heveanensis CBS 569]
MERRSRLPRAASNPSIKPPPQSQANESSGRLGGAPIKLGRLGRPTLSRQPSMPLRSGTTRRPVAVAARASQQPVLASTVTDQRNLQVQVPPSCDDTFCNVSNRPIKASSTDIIPAPAPAPARRLLPVRSTLALTGTNTASSTSTNPLKAGTTGTSTVPTSARPIARLTSKASLRVLAPKRTVPAQRSTSTLNLGVGGTGSVDQKGRVGTLRQRGKSPLAAEIVDVPTMPPSSGTDSQNGSTARGARAGKTLAPLGSENQSGLQRRKVQPRTKYQSAATSTLTTSATPSKAYQGLGTPSRPTQPSSTQIETPCSSSRIPTSTCLTPALPRLVSTTTWASPTLHTGKNILAGRLDDDDDGDQQQLKNVELSFTGTVDDETETTTGHSGLDGDGDGDGNGSFVNSLDFRFATSRFAPPRGTFSSISTSASTLGEDSGSIASVLNGNLFSLTRNSGIEYQQAGERRHLEAALERAESERDRTVASLIEMKREAVHSAWGQVVRAGVSDLDDLRSMLSLLRELSEDLGQIGDEDVSPRVSVGSEDGA